MTQPRDPVKTLEGDAREPCAYCGGSHPNLQCGRIEEIQYDSLGRVASVKLRAPRYMDRLRIGGS